MRRIPRKNIFYIIWLLLSAAESYYLGRLKGHNDRLEALLHQSISQTNEAVRFVKYYEVRGDSL